VLKTARIPRLSWILNRLRLHRWLTAESTADRVDVIEVPEYSGALPLPFRRCPVVVRIHLSHATIATTAGLRPNWMIRTCESLTLRSHRHWIAVSHHAHRLTQETFRLPPSTSKVIYYPVLLPTEPDPKTLPALPKRFVLYAGTISARKGAYRLAEAARRFLREDPSTDLVYAGVLAKDAGVRADHRITDIVGPDLASRVHFLGRLERPVLVACMRRASVFAFPSALETFGLVVGEAMLAGIPVVVPRVPPFNEFVTDEITGLVVPPDNPDALSEAIVRLLRSPQLSARLGTAGHRLIESTFSLQRAVTETERFYKEISAPGTLMSSL
jgi:glycosyltransferase involved in cell wall biosynthesis